MKSKANEKAGRAEMEAPPISQHLAQVTEARQRPSSDASCPTRRLKLHSLETASYLRGRCVRVTELSVAGHGSHVVVGDVESTPTTALFGLFQLAIGGGTNEPAAGSEFNRRGGHCESTMLVDEHTRTVGWRRTTWVALSFGAHVTTHSRHSRCGLYTPVRRDRAGLGDDGRTGAIELATRAADRE